MFKKSILAIVAVAMGFLPLGIVGNDAEDMLMVTSSGAGKTWIVEWFSDPMVIWTTVALLIFLVLIIACFMYLKKLDS